MSCRLVTDEPDSMGAQVFDVIAFVRVFLPARTPALIRSSVIVEEDLVHSVAVNVEIKPPVGIVYVVGITGKSAALNDGPYFAVV